MHCLRRKAGTTKGEHAARHVWKFEDILKLYQFDQELSAMIFQ